MLTVLFWNMGGQDRAHLCARLAHRHEVTVLILAECPQPDLVFGALNPPGQPALYNLLVNPTTPGEAREARVQVFTRLPSAEWVRLRTERHFAIDVLDRIGVPELLLCAAHLPSPLHTSERERDDSLRRLGAAISEAESQRGHTRTLLVGDLNADPFQYGVYSPDGLHAVPTRQVALQRTRTVGGTDYPFFFNPMWRFFSDATPGPPGTYYRRKAQHDVRFWYMFDQILLRPDLLQYFDDQNLEIVTTDGQTSFAGRDGRPNPKAGSDHFPILIRLSYPGV